MRGRTAVLRAAACAVVLASASCAEPRRDHDLPVVRTSSPLSLSPDGKVLWTVNPDSNTVTRIDTESLTVLEEIAVGTEPWSVAALDSGAVVLNRADGTLTVIADGLASTVSVGPEPGGLVVGPAGRFAYVTVSSQDAVAIVDLEELLVSKSIEVGRLPWAIGAEVQGDEVELVVTHRLAGRNGHTGPVPEAVVTLITGDAVKAELVVPGGADYVPNVLDGLAIQGRTAWVTHLIDRPQSPRRFFSTLGAGLSTIDIDAGHVATLELSDSDFSSPVNFPRAVAVTRDARTAYVVLAGNDAVMGIDLRGPTGPRLIGFWGVGANPRGIALSHDETKAYVMNYLSRDVSVLDLANGPVSDSTRVPTTSETLSPEVLLGKTLFNSASDPRMSRIGWTSCGSCHVDGGADGITWSMPDGPRQTMPLWRAGETAPFHASATRDEIQDFEHDIRAFFGGTGLANQPPPPMLGPPAKGASEGLDALAAYVESGIRAPTAPVLDADDLLAGRDLFVDLDCASCHGGPNWTMSHLPGEVGTLAPGGEPVVIAALADVGTYAQGSDVLGSNGFDVPSLVGLHATLPYLHDGSAPDLTTLLLNDRHVGRELDPDEAIVLATFLSSIDDTSAPFD